jgi:hypothetical protein
MTDEDMRTDTPESLAVVDYLRGKILMEAARNYDAANNSEELERAKCGLIAAIQNGPRYHPWVVPTPLTDEMIDDTFDDSLGPDAWKAKMIAEIEAKHRAKSGSDRTTSAKHRHSGLRKRLIVTSVSVLLATVALLLHWRIGVVVSVILLAFVCCRSEFWSE